MIPVVIGIVDRDFLAHSDTLGHEHDTLDAEPREAFVLRIRLARVVDESSAVAPKALPDLICACGASDLHDVEVADAVGDDPDEFADPGAAFEWLRFPVLVWWVLSILEKKGHSYTASN